jgi:hypothetical protein
MTKIYNPDFPEPFKLSRSKLELFTQCPYCFYLDRRLGLPRPPGFPFTLNSAVDALLKRECDGYRAKKIPHPIATEYELDAMPYQPDPPELLDTWRNNFQGIAFLHEPTNFHVYGAIDDVWVAPTGELIIIDYKATSKKAEIQLNQAYHETYKRQLELYSWLFTMNGYPVHEQAYFIYCNGIKDTESFKNCLTFKTVLIPHILDMSWIEEALMQAYHCLRQPTAPSRSSDCQFCTYLSLIEEISG